MHTKDHSRTLLDIILSHAPNQYAEDIVVDWWQEIYTNCKPGIERELAMCEILHDGLRRGNWPWNISPSVWSAKKQD